MPSCVPAPPEAVEPSRRVSRGCPLDGGAERFVSTSSTSLLTDLVSVSRVASILSKRSVTEASGFGARFCACLWSMGAVTFRSFLFLPPQPLGTRSTPRGGGWLRPFTCVTYFSSLWWSPGFRAFMRRQARVVAGTRPRLTCSTFGKFPRTSTRRTSVLAGKLGCAQESTRITPLGPLTLFFSGDKSRTGSPSFNWRQRLSIYELPHDAQMRS